MSHYVEKSRPSFLGAIIRFFIAAIVLVATSYIVPGFFVAGFWTAFLAAIVIAAIDYLISAAFNFNASPFGRGVVGFLVSALIIYLTQFIVGGVVVSIWGAILAAFVIGVLDIIIPVRLM
ncbi:4 TMS phage holin, superfamily IV [Caloramator quimbayensis]|uniref:4 TMS phage holin, superfamily IV n=1 Tax=Caloramator quimbayensis TaxID=1147123 RepID=A0A1T4X2S7_9CLOT|nr:phage holin family protein [Caloramator quimbayensis]SKA83759.1 4 TMS phage holin, superfamily IV [Caloramator quimbayensis]